MSKKISFLLSFVVGVLLFSPIISFATPNNPISLNHQSSSRFFEYLPDDEQNVIIDPEVDWNLPDLYDENVIPSIDPNTHNTIDGSISLLISINPINPSSPALNPTALFNMSHTNYLLQDHSFFGYNEPNIDSSISLGFNTSPLTDEGEIPSSIFPSNPDGKNYEEIFYSSFNYDDFDTGSQVIVGGYFSSFTTSFNFTHTINKSNFSPSDFISSLSLSVDTKNWFNPSSNWNWEDYNLSLSYKIDSLELVSSSPILDQPTSTSLVFPSEPFETSRSTSEREDLMNSHYSNKLTYTPSSKHNTNEYSSPIDITHTFVTDSTISTSSTQEGTKRTAKSLNNISSYEGYSISTTSNSFYKVSSLSDESNNPSPPSLPYPSKPLISSSSLTSNNPISDFWDYTKTSQYVTSPDTIPNSLLKTVKDEIVSLSPSMSEYLELSSLTLLSGDLTNTYDFNQFGFDKYAFSFKVTPNSITSNDPDWVFPIPTFTFVHSVYVFDSSQLFSVLFNSRSTEEHTSVDPWNNRILSETAWDLLDIASPETTPLINFGWNQDRLTLVQKFVFENNKLLLTNESDPNDTLLSIEFNEHFNIQDDTTTKKVDFTFEQVITNSEILTFSLDENNFNSISSPEKPEEGDFYHPREYTEITFLGFSFPDSPSPFFPSITSSTSGSWINLSYSTGDLVWTLSSIFYNVIVPPPNLYFKTTDALGNFVYLNHDFYVLDYDEKPEYDANNGWFVKEDNNNYVSAFNYSYIPDVSLINNSGSDHDKFTFQPNSDLELVLGSHFNDYLNTGEYNFWFIEESFGYDLSEFRTLDGRTGEVDFMELLINKDNWSRGEEEMNEYFDSLNVSSSSSISDELKQTLSKEVTGVFSNPVSLHLNPFFFHESDFLNPQELGEYEQLIPTPEVYNSALTQSPTLWREMVELYSKIKDTSNLVSGDDWTGSFPQELIDLLVTEDGDPNGSNDPPNEIYYQLTGVWTHSNESPKEYVFKRSNKDDHHDKSLDEYGLSELNSSFGFRYDGGVMNESIFTDGSYTVGMDFSDENDPLDESLTSPAALKSPWYNDIKNGISFEVRPISTPITLNNSPSTKFVQSDELIPYYDSKEEETTVQIDTRGLKEVVLSTQDLDGNWYYDNTLSNSAITPGTSWELNLRARSIYMLELTYHNSITPYRSFIDTTMFDLHIFDLDNPDGLIDSTSYPTPYGGFEQMTENVFVVNSVEHSLVLNNVSYPTLNLLRNSITNSNTSFDYYSHLSYSNNQYFSHWSPLSFDDVNDKSKLTSSDPFLVPDLYPHYLSDSNHGGSAYHYRTTDSEGKVLPSLSTSSLSGAIPPGLIRVSGVSTLMHFVDGNLVPVPSEDKYIYINQLSKDSVEKDKIFSITDFLKQPELMFSDEDLKDIFSNYDSEFLEEILIGSDEGFNLIKDIVDNEYKNILISEYSLISELRSETFKNLHLMNQSQDQLQTFYSNNTDSSGEYKLDKIAKEISLFASSSDLDHMEWYISLDEEINYFKDIYYVSFPDVETSQPSTSDPSYWVWKEAEDFFTNGLFEEYENSMFQLNEDNNDYSSELRKYKELLSDFNSLSSEQQYYLGIVENYTSLFESNLEDFLSTLTSTISDSPNLYQKFQAQVLLYDVSNAVEVPSNHLFPTWLLIEKDLSLEMSNSSVLNYSTQPIQSLMFTNNQTGFVSTLIVGDESNSISYSWITFSYNSSTGQVFVRDYTGEGLIEVSSSIEDPLISYPGFNFTGDMMYSGKYFENIQHFLQRWNQTSKDNIDSDWEDVESEVDDWEPSPPPPPIVPVPEEEKPDNPLDPPESSVPPDFSPELPSSVPSSSTTTILFGFGFGFTGLGALSLIIWIRRMKSRIIK